jgi:hypothetical protein
MKLPQKCPNKKCGKSLADPGVPWKYKRYRAQFTLAVVDGEVEVEPRDAKTAWVCPFCEHRWTTPGIA